METISKRNNHRSSEGGRGKRDTEIEMGERDRKRGRKREQRNSFPRSSEVGCILTKH